MSEKTQAEILKEELFAKQEHAVYTCEENEVAVADEFCEGYKKFLDVCKTEREAASYTKELAIKEGYVEFDPKASYKAGDKVYCDIHSKALILCTFGTESLEKGAKIVASHIDSPRLDLKPNPLYEDAELALFKTHYYGGIKKYQWTAIPLALHGVVFKRDGSCINISLGDDEGDPVFVVTDLLPHLDKKQASRPLDEAIEGGKKVKFHYSDFNLKLEREKRIHYGKPAEYIINPYQMVASNGRYYLIGNYDKFDNVSHYRIDRIIDIEIIDEPVKPMKKVNGLKNGLDLPKHMAEHIYMYCGESVKVKFRTDKDIINDIVDWFGTAIKFSNETEETVDVSVKVNENAMFHWAMQYGTYVEVLEPHSLREKLADAVRAMNEKYSK